MKNLDCIIHILSIIIFYDFCQKNYHIQNLGTREKKNLPIVHFENKIWNENIFLKNSDFFLQIKGLHVEKFSFRKLISKIKMSRYAIRFLIHKYGFMREKMDILQIFSEKEKLVTILWGCGESSWSSEKTGKNFLLD